MAFDLWLVVGVLLAVIVIRPWVKWKMKQSRIYKRLSRYSNFFITLVPVSLVIFLIHIQYNNQWLISSVIELNLNDAFTFSFGLLGLYGIYFGFLQFLVGYNKNDIYLGRSKANHLIKTTGKTIVFNNGLFKVMLWLLLILPLMVHLQVVEDYRDILLVVWQTSGGYLLLTYVMLLSRSLKVIRVMLVIKENDDFFLENDIEQGIQDQYLSYFTYDFKHTSDVFYYALHKDLENIQESERVIFYKKVFQEITYLDTVHQLRKVDRQHVYRYYRKFLERKWDHLISTNLTFDHLLSFWITDMVFLLSVIQDDGETFMESLDRQRHHHFPLHQMLFDKIFKKAETPEDVDQLVTDLMNRIVHRFKHVDEDHVKEYLNDFISNIHKQLLVHYFDHKQLVTMNAIKTFMDVDEPEEEHSKRVMDLLMNHFGHIRDKLNQRQKQNMKNILTMINEKYRLAYILYQLFYPDQAEWDINIDLYQELLKDMNIPSDRLGFFKEVANIVGCTHIGHRLTYETCQWMFDTMDDDFTYEFLQQIQDRGLPLFKVLFVQQYLSIYPSAFSRLNGHIETDDSVKLGVNTEYLNIAFEHPDALNEPVVKWAVKQILRWALQHKGVELFNYLRWEGIFILEESQREYLSNFDQTRENIGENLCKFYIMKLNDDAYEELFGCEAFLNVFLQKTRKLLAVYDMKVKELVDQLVLDIEPWQRIGKYEVDIIFRRLQSLLDATYLPLNIEGKVIQTTK